MKNDFSILKQIWQNRGFGKYSLFGGLAFYFRLRIQFFAYLSAFLTSLVLLGGVYTEYKAYEPSYWRKSVYFGEDEKPEFLFEANVFYTVRMNDNLDYIIVNGVPFMSYTRERTRENDFNIPFKFQKVFHIQFPYTVTITIVPELDFPIDFVISEKVEVWKGVKGGQFISYEFLKPSHYIYTPPVQPPQPKKQKKKK